MLNHPMHTESPDPRSHLALDQSVSLARVRVNFSFFCNRDLRVGTRPIRQRAHSMGERLNKIVRAGGISVKWSACRIDASTNTATETRQFVMHMSGPYIETPSSVMHVAARCEIVGPFSPGLEAVLPFVPSFDPLCR